ncbi:hypothetical protein K2X33_00405 [bacterium]|nr:hypothetical protein [bacterium]
MNKTFTAILAILALLSGCAQSDSFFVANYRSDVFVQEYDDTKFDFLWVLDNSGSMSVRREFVKDNMQGFLNILNSRKAVDFQMAVTTTDMFSNSGALIQSTGGLSVVKSATSSDPVADFASIVDAVADSPTSFWEQGLESAYQAISQHYSEFSRPGVPLIIIVVTDEDDYSCADHCWGVEPENNPDDVEFDVSRYITYFSGIKAAENSTTYLFPIVGLPTSSCTVSSLGERYEEVQVGLGGLSRSGSICNGELRSSYETIAQIITDRGMVFPLSGTASGNGIIVSVDGSLIPFSPENYEYDAQQNAIVFTGVIPRSGAVIEVSYTQGSN